MPTLKLAIDAREARSGAAEFDNAAKKVERGARDAAKSTQDLGGKIDGLGPAAGKLKVAFAAAGASITAAFALNQAKNAIAGYEQVMANLRGVTGATTEEMQRFDATAKALGSSTQFSPEEVASGLLNLAKAGFTTTQAIGTIKPALDLAIGGELSLAEATETVGSTLAQFRLKVGDSARVANVLVIAANATQASVQSIGDSMKYAGPLAAGLGVSLESTAAAVGILSNAGIQGSSAGTNLRGIMAALISPTREAEQVIKRLGLTLEDVNVQTHGLVQPLADLKAAGAGPADLEKIFSKLNVSASIALGELWKEVDVVTEKMKTNKTAAEDLARIMGDTLNGRFKTLGSTISSVWIKLGEGGLGGAMRGAVDFATDLVRAIAGLGGASRTGSAAVVVLANSIKGAAAGLAAFIALKGAIALFDFAKGALAAGNAFSRLSVLIAANPIGALAVAIGLIVALFLTFKDEVVKLGDEFTTFGDLMAATWDFMRDVAVAAWGGITEFLRGSWAWITGTFDAVATWIGDRWSSLTEGMSVDWSGLFDSVLSLLKKVANAIIGTFVAIARIIGTIADTVVQTAGAIANFDFSKPGASFGKIADALDPKKVFEAAKAKVSESYAEDYVGTVIGAVVNAYKGASAKLAPAIEIASAALDAAKNEIVRRAVVRTKTRVAEEDTRRLKEEQERAAAAAAELNRKMQDLEGGITKAGEAADDAAAKIQGLREEIAQEVAALEREVAMRGATSDEIERANALFDFATRAKKAEIEGVDALVAKYGDLYDAVKLANQQREERARSREALDTMQQDIELLQFVGAEREREAGLLALTKNAKHLDAAETAALTAEYENLFRQLREAKAIRAVSDDLATSFGRAFESIALDAASLGDALETLFLDVRRQLLQAIVIRPLVDSISGALGSLFSGSGAGSLLSSAHGNAFDEAGRVVRYAKGGVTNGPEYFPLAGGATGLRGEAARKEGVLPLARMPNGDLGVQASGDEGGGGNVFNFKIYTQDADSFRASKRQIFSDFRRATGGGSSQ